MVGNDPSGRWRTHQSFSLEPIDYQDGGVLNGLPNDLFSYKLVTSRMEESLMISRSAQRCLISSLLCFAAVPAASQTIEVTVEPPGVQTSSVSGVVTETFDST